jgi:hypothetical protein
MSLPNSVIDTGTSIFGCRTFIDELIPNCNRCFVISGNHIKTKEPGFYAFCNKSGNDLENVGPYTTYHEALKVLVLTKGCDSCTLNNFKLKDAYLPYLNEKFKEEMTAIYGTDQSLTIVVNPVHNFVESRKYLDLNFQSRFNFKLFLSIMDDNVAVVDLIKPCISSQDFALKIQALAGIIDRLNEKELRERIRKKDKEKIQGSLKVLEQFLKENLPNYPLHTISNLRNLMALRSKMYPAHVTTSDIIIILKNFGIDKYPLDKWEEGISKIVGLCANSLDDLTSAVQKN